MKILKLFRRFSRKKEQYLPIFSQQAAYLVQAARSLCRLVGTEDQSIWRQCEREIKACEVQGDALLAELQEQLYEDMLSAVTRTDMQAIAMDMDEFMDGMNYSAKAVLLYMPDRIDSQIRDLAQYIYSEADAIKTMIPLLGNIKRNHQLISVQCERITEIEHAADDTYAEYIGYIFTSEANAIDVMKYKNIVEAFEAATDSAKKLSDGVRKILMRYID